MSSILTNNSAMVALSTLRGINKGLGDIQNQISTGKKVGNAKDNAATWAISAVMKSDVTGYKAITETLALGSSTLNVARSGAETVNKLLDELKGRVVSAQADNVDRDKINDDASELIANIEATVTASQFNGLNLLQGVVGETSVDVVGSLDRDAAGNVTVANITVDRASLEAASTVGTAGTWAGATPATTALAATNVATFGAAATDLAAGLYAEGDVIALQLTNSAGQGVVLSYAVQASDLDAADTTANLATAAVAAWNTQLTAADTAGTFDNTGITLAAATNNITIAIADTQTVDITYQSAQGGGLTALSLMDLSTAGGAAAALDAIEGLTQTSIEAAANFGASGKRVDIQMDFLKNLTDSLTTGIGSIVDTDMEEASARLQALQVQQQLGVQSLSIANQQPQTLLSLFR